MCRPSRSGAEASATLATVIETAAKGDEDTCSVLTNLLTPDAPLCPSRDPCRHRVSNYLPPYPRGAGRWPLVTPPSHECFAFSARIRAGERKAGLCTNLKEERPKTRRNWSVRRHDPVSRGLLGMTQCVGQLQFGFLHQLILAPLTRGWRMPPHLHPQVGKACLGESGYHPRRVRPRVHTPRRLVSHAGAARPVQGCCSCSSGRM